MACRYDWHQTGSQVVISVFAKASHPDKSFVNANAVKCKIHIVFGEEQSVFDTEIVLGGVSSAHRILSANFHSLKFGEEVETT